MDILQHSLPHILREIAEQCMSPVFGYDEWARVLWRASRQLEILYLNTGLNADAVPDPTQISTLEEARSYGEKMYLQRVMFVSYGDKTQAAHLLGISRTALYKALWRNKLIEEKDHVIDV